MVTTSAGTEMDEINASIRARNAELKGQPPQKVRIDAGPSAAEQAGAIKRLNQLQTEKQLADRKAAFALDGAQKSAAHDAKNRAWLEDFHKKFDTRLRDSSN